jgi:OOP family OmpA-OmpF porin
MSSHRNVKVFFLVFLGVILLSSCATHQLPPFQAQEVDSSGYVPKFNNFVLLVDSSQSMSYPWFSKNKRLYVAQDVARRLSETIPHIPINAGLRTFGHGVCDRHENLSLLYGVKPYNKAEFAQSLHKIECANGKTPISAAIHATNGDLRRVNGAHAVIIISDGIPEYMDSDPVIATMDLKDRYGDLACVFTIHVGDNSDGKEILKKVTDAGQCGFPVNAGAIMSSAGMADYVKKVFLAIDSDGDGVPDERDNCPGTPRGVKVDERGCPLDSDGDGVPDYLDNCPDTPSGVAVDIHGCPLDSDGDGVPDYLDECPDTPLGTVVDDKGCPLPKKEKFIIQFDFDSSVIKEEAKTVLDLAAALLQENPEMRVRIEGHTCDIGTVEYNYDLSVRRAQATKNYLITRGIEPYRMEILGKGELSPAVPNIDEAHRRLNRRAEFIVIETH